MDEWAAMGLELSEDTKSRLMNYCAEFGLSVEHVAAVFRELGERFSDAWNELAEQIDDWSKPRQRKRWPRPKNDRVKLLLLDRRPKLYRCRNNC